MYVLQIALQDNTNIHNFLQNAVKHKQKFTSLYLHCCAAVLECLFAISVLY